MYPLFFSISFIICSVFCVIQFSRNNLLPLAHSSFFLISLVTIYTHAVSSLKQMLLYKVYLLDNLHLHTLLSLCGLSTTPIMHNIRWNRFCYSFKKNQNIFRHETVNALLFQALSMLTLCCQHACFEIISLFSCSELHLKHASGALGCVMLKSAT